ncbi:FAR1 DNA binding domain [Dillenia turbinata]|uniref:Protein FAR1-RELATED SEQUENCE n=1 Tax=Dillenia turbinata TaxID=194707 RepID=A0AAN8UNV9_9MAGN
MWHKVGEAMNVIAYQGGSTGVNNNAHGGEERGSRVEPSVGLEFDSAEEAKEFYSIYATNLGFKIRIGQLSRSKADGSVISRKFVCSKEGFQINSRTGCPAFIKVQKVESGKWIIEGFQKDHNHEFESPGTIQNNVQGKAHAVAKSTVKLSYRPVIRSAAENEPQNLCLSGIVNVKRLKWGDGGQNPIFEPCVGLEFDSFDDAYKFYDAYAANAGFKIRIGQLIRSRDDGSILSRRFVCSKEGHQHHSRLGCGAFIRVQRQESGKWVLDRLMIEHNHELGSPMEAQNKVPAALKISKAFVKAAPKACPLGAKGGGNIKKRNRENNIGADWYPVLLEYFQSKQAKDTGFFYAVEVDDGKCKSLFWADSQSRFSGGLFGDAIVFDTTYRSNNYIVPLAMFLGVNHHRQPVLLACAVIADESKESYVWVFQTWLRAMSGRCPVSMIVDQDEVIEQAIAQVFPETHCRFSTWQIKGKEHENLSTLLSVDSSFKYEYEKCIYQSRTPDEFSSGWYALIKRYNLKQNVWLEEMYEKRENWVPLYLRRTFFAGIPIGGGLESFFGSLLTCETPLSEFVPRYERGLEQRREEEKEEDFNSSTMQAFLHSKEPLEEQCRRLYTTIMFKIFQKELIECSACVGTKIYEEGVICRYMVRKSGNENEHAVTFDRTSLNVSCSCQMFEFEGVLCRHVLKVFNIMNVKEIPPRYILPRWMKNVEYGIFYSFGSGGGFPGLKPLMEWSLREETRQYIEAGVSSLERFKLAIEIMREGRRNLSWQK